MARRAEWQIAWEKLHNITARQAMLAHIAAGATLQKVAFEFGANLREVRTFCRKEGLPIPVSVIELDEKEKARRAEQARKNLGNRTIASGPPIVVMGVSKSRHQWYKMLGGALGNYYDKDEERVQNFILAQLKEKKESDLKPQKKRKVVQRTNFTEQRNALRAALPQAREAVKNLTEKQLRARLKGILSSVSSAKGALKNDTEQNPPASS